MSPRASATALTSSAIARRRRRSASCARTAGVGMPARLGEKTVEDLVHEVASLDRRELHDVFGALDRFDVQHGVHEIRVRARGPRLQTGR